MRLLVVEAPGVLYASDESPPNALPITSGLRLVRALTDGWGVPVCVVGQLDAQNHGELLRSWMKTYDVSFAHTVTSDKGGDRMAFWEEDVLTFLGGMQAQPPVAVTASPLVAEMLCRRAVPTIQFRPPDGNAPNWGPQRPSWTSKFEYTEE